jgi:hypothetical protein
MNDQQLEALVNHIALESGGGLSVGTLYGDVAMAVAKAVRERCAKSLEDAAARLLAPKRTNEVDRHTAAVLQDHAARIRGA